MTQLNFIITFVFCKIDDYFRSRWPKMHREGRKEKMSDSEILTMMVVGNLMGLRYENRILQWFKNLFPDDFHYLSQSQLNRRLQGLTHQIKIFFRYIAKKFFTDSSDLQFVDSTDLAVCKNTHIVTGYKRFSDRISKGYKASKKLFFTGVKLHCFVNRRGQSINFGITKANIHDLPAFKKIKTKQKGISYVADKAYIDEKLNISIQKKYDQQVIAPTRINQAVKNSAYAKKLLRERQKVEQGYSVEKTYIGLDVQESKCFSGLLKTLSIKMLSFSFLTLVNEAISRPLYSFFPFL